MKRKTLRFVSQWQTGIGWEPTAKLESDFDRIAKVGRVTDANTTKITYLFTCFSAFGESHVLTGYYETA